MKQTAAMLLSILTLGCASVPVQPASSLFDDALFGAPSQRIEPAEIMALSDEMRRYIESDILPAAEHKDLRRTVAGQR